MTAVTTAPTADLTIATDAPIALQILDNGWVDARALHMTLLVGRDFSTWIKDKLSDFEKGNDYRLPGSGELDNTGKIERIDYHLSLDMAKQICMLERNNRGKAVRKYFVECEKSFHNTRNQLEMMLNDPDNAVLVFQKMADQKRELATQKRITEYSQVALSSSQQNTAKQTRKVHALEAELLQLNRMVSMVQWTILRKPNLQGLEPKRLTRAVREMIQAQGHEPIQKTLPGDKHASWTFKISWLDDNTDRITAIAAEVAFGGKKPKKGCHLSVAS